MSRIALSVAIAALALAFGSQRPASGAPTRSADAYSSLAALYLKVGAVIVGDRAKCARMVPDVAAWNKAHPQLKGLSAATAALPTLAHGQGEATFKARLAAEQLKMGAAQKACGKTAAFQATYTLFRPLFYPIIVVLP